MTKHDPTEEAETLPGIPKAGSDLEQFPSIPGIVGGALSLDVAVQEIVTSGTPSRVLHATVTISAVDTSRAYVTVKGSIQPPTTTGGARDFEGESYSIVWNLLDSTTIEWWRDGLVGTNDAQTVRFHVIEYL